MSRTDLTAARRAATFVALLEGDVVTGPTLNAAIARTIRRYGARGCSEIVAVEYGDHPEAAMPRMKRARHLVLSRYPATDTATHLPHNAYGSAAA